MVLFEDNYKAYIDFNIKYINYNFLKDLIHTYEINNTTATLHLFTSNYIQELNNINKFIQNKVLYINFMIDETNEWIIYLKNENNGGIDNKQKQKAEQIAK